MQNKEECGSYFDVLQERLVSPPMFTTLRLNTTKYSAEEIHAIISQELQKVHENMGVKIGDNQLGYNYFKNPFTDRFSHNIFFFLWIVASI